jgi:UDP-3-O-[3-hydroxymyristoyl] glucosamine N-acyltransferase
MKFSEIVVKLNPESSSLINHPELDPDITGVTAIDLAQVTDISYIEGGKFAAFIETTNAKALILPQDEHLQSAAIEKGIAWVASKDPRLMFAQTIDIFYQPFTPSPRIHSTAIIDANVEIGTDVYIGANVLISSNVKIGNNVCIHPNVVIDHDVEIGDRSILHANCTIRERSRIGKNCVIHSGVVVGAEAFDFDINSVPTNQLGYTILEDGVEVGCNTTIARPVVGETRIGTQTKIDNLVQISGGCIIGNNCAIAGQSGLSSGVKMGNQILIAGQVGVAKNVTIGDGAIATARAGVIYDVKPKEVVSGFPAISHKIWLKTAAIYAKLPEIYQSLKKSL